ncbi:hypothetical protein [Geomonas paludis]|uniref:Uncharacterized protein n=1 Tax=Geomonas paludis TaxID=2740185 RepID=A0A6V8MW75_9BACT|nr:hypothetical protein [Geomonas paludis]GFO63843.1 hypothetical protein GMPD_17620 [Geomonas paludis]
MLRASLWVPALALALVALTRTDAHAYIDPNTGGYVFQVLFPIISGIAAAFVFCRDGIVKLVRKIFRRPDGK